MGSIPIQTKIGTSPVRNNNNGNNGGLDIFGSVEASDDAIWNSKTVHGWLNKQASPRQRRRFNEVYLTICFNMKLIVVRLWTYIYTQMLLYI